MKHFLGIVGSPRRNGNTHLLVDKILDGAKAAGAKADIVLLGDLTIRECDGCHTCWRGKPCCKKDDMNDLYRRIIESDVLVLGTPVYGYGPTALMKSFIDRLVYFNCPANRALVRGKQAFLVIPFEENDPRTAALTVAFFKKSLAYLEIILAGKLLAPGVMKKGAVFKKPGLMGTAFKMGQKISKNLPKTPS